MNDPLDRLTFEVKLRIATFVVYGAPSDLQAFEHAHVLLSFGPLAAATATVISRYLARLNCSYLEAAFDFQLAWAPLPQREIRARHNPALNADPLEYVEFRRERLDARSKFERESPLKLAHALFLYLDTHAEELVAAAVQRPTRPREALATAMVSRMLKPVRFRSRTIKDLPAELMLEIVSFALFDEPDLLRALECAISLLHVDLFAVPVLALTRITRPYFHQMIANLTSSMMVPLSRIQAGISGRAEEEHLMGLLKAKMHFETRWEYFISMEKHVRDRMQLY